jgi:hypothetical protein
MEAALIAVITLTCVACTVYLVAVYRSIRADNEER